MFLELIHFWTNEIGQSKESLEVVVSILFICGYYLHMWKDLDLGHPLYVCMHTCRVIFDFQWNHVVLSMIFNLSNSYYDKLCSFTFLNLYDFQQKLQCENTKASAPTSLIQRQNIDASPHQIAHM
jgi:hypothetical protein